VSHLEGYVWPILLEVFDFPRCFPLVKQGYTFNEPHFRVFDCDRTAMSVKFFPTKASRHIDLDADRESPRRARCFAQQTLEEWGVSQIGDEVTLAVSELITNALVHGKSDVELTIIDLGNGVQVRVTDKAPEHPKLRHVDDQSTGGRGLHIVDRVADSWGVESDPPGKTIWVDITQA
jgi:anti-sigma regulatory factor (Ser/Thr protein kinase)